MSDTATSAFLERWKAREKFQGEDGRVYTLRELRPSEMLKINDMLQDCDKSTSNVMSIVASICEVNTGNETVPIFFPKKRADLDGLLDRVGMKGIYAANPLVKKLNGVDDAEAEKEAEPAETDAS